MIIRWMLAGLLAVGFLVVILLGVFSQDLESQEPPRTFVRSAECRECHPEVYAEWQASWHAQAWTDPFVRAKDMADDFKKKDCIPCHAPRPIFERGIVGGQRVVERAANREDGVDCISCHRLPDGGFAASLLNPRGPCGPAHHPLLSTPALCAPCHNQHNTVTEWEEAPEHLKGEGCNDCHMPAKIRQNIRSGGTRPGRDHTFYGGHFEEFLKDSFSLTYSVEPGVPTRRLSVQVINDKCAHNLPTDSRHRALDLIVTFYKKGGVPYPPDEPRLESGQAPGTHRKRFRNPYRSETDKVDTQIRAGQSDGLDVPIPSGAARVLIQVVYKLEPLMEDEEGFELYRQEIDLGTDKT